MKNMIFTMMGEFETKLPYYAVGIGYNYAQENINRPNGFPNYQWIQCRRGRGELKIGSKFYSIGENQGMLLFPGVPHEYYSVTEVWEVDWIIFGGLHIEDFFKITAEINASGVYFIARPDIIRGNLHRVFEIESSGSAAKSLAISSVVYELLMDIVRFLSKKTDSGMVAQYNRIKPVIEYIDENYNRLITLSDLSEVLKVTPQHLCNMFKKVTSQRVFEYINLKRIQKSKELLLQQEQLQIKEISSIVGFDDVSYFCSLFRKIEQISPGEFRRLHI